MSEEFRKVGSATFRQSTRLHRAFCLPSANNLASLPHALVVGGSSAGSGGLLPPGAVACNLTRHTVTA